MAVSNNVFELWRERLAAPPAISDTNQTWCLRLTKQWYGVLQSLLAELDWQGAWLEYGASWLNLRDDIHRIIGQDASCLPGESDPGTAAGDGDTGGFILCSVEQFEFLVWEVVSMIDISQYIKCEGGVLYVKDGCCNWIELCTIPQRDSGDQPLGGTTWGDLEELGRILAAATPPKDFIDVPTNLEPSHQWADGYAACAKATALADLILVVIEATAEAMLDVHNGITGISAIPSAVLAVTQPIAALVVQFTFQGLESLLNSNSESDLTAIVAAAQDGSARENVACALMPYMSPYRYVSQTELLEAYSAIEDSLPNPAGAFAVDMTHYLNSEGVTEYVARQAALGDCACADLIPGTPGLPPVAAGDFRFDYIGMAKATDPAGDCSLPTTYVGQSFAWAAVDPHGIAWESLLKTEELCDVGGQINAYFGMLLEFSEPATLTDIRLDGFLEQDSSNPYSDCWGWHPASGAWIDAGGASGLSSTGGFKTYDLLSGTVNDITHLVVTLKTRYTGGIDFFVTNLRLTGTYSGGSFTTLSVGELHEG